MYIRFKNISFLPRCTFFSQSTPIYSLIPCLFDWGVTRGIRLGAGGPVERRIPIVFIYPVAQLELHCFFISWSDADTMPEFRARIFPTRSATLNLSDSVCTETFVPYTSFFRYSPNSSVFATFLAELSAGADTFFFRFMLPGWISKVVVGPAPIAWYLPARRSVVDWRCRRVLRGHGPQRRISASSLSFIYFLEDVTLRRSPLRKK